MKIEKRRFKEALVKFAGDIFRTLAYTLLIVYLMHNVFGVELNPAFPIQNEFLLVGSIGCALLYIACRAIELNQSKKG